MKRLFVIASGTVALTMFPAHAESALERGAYLMKGIVACGNRHTAKVVDI